MLFLEALFSHFSKGRDYNRLSPAHGAGGAGPPGSGQHSGGAGGWKPLAAHLTKYLRAVIMSP